jgi:2-haloacid dehalogenase
MSEQESMNVIPDDRPVHASPSTSATSIGGTPEAAMSAPDSAEQKRRQVLSRVKALTFDVFGTVVDWRSSIIREGQALSRAKGISLDCERFADAWRGGYRPAMDRVERSELPWVNIDGLHRMILDELLVQFGIKGLSEAEIDDLNRAWHRLAPWPDAVLGLSRLRSRYLLATLSNGNMALLVNMARNAGLPWDCILSAELAGHYKPAPQAYQMASRLLGLPPSEIMMVAAHSEDLRAARQEGFRTAFVARPTEYGPGRSGDPAPAGEVDLIATDLLDLAEQLAD